MSGVQLDCVTKIYSGGVKAVHQASFAAPDGAMCVLVGPSGCGKSTLLRMIAGLETISDGQILIGGRVVNTLEPAQRDIAMVFQNYALYPHMSVYDNMAYGLRNLKTPKDEIFVRVQEVAKLLDLTDDLLQRKPKQLSGGQRQRVAMGRAIVRKPKVFLFDEPLSNLDAKLRGQMRLAIRKLQKDLRTTAVYVTHDQLEAMTLADMLVVMKAGEIQQIGAPMELYERPANQFVAGFLGSPPMNFLRAVVEGVGRLRLEDGQALDYDPAHFAPPTGASVIAGVRPERVFFSEGEGLVFSLEFEEELGLGRLVHGRVGGENFVLATPPGARRPSTAFIKAAPADVHLFDAVNGRRVAA